MICAFSLHKWKIARKNEIYCLDEITCEVCGLVYPTVLTDNGHNGHFEEPVTPGYRTRRYLQLAKVNDRKFTGISSSDDWIKQGSVSSRHSPPKLT